MLPSGSTILILNKVFFSQTKKFLPANGIFVLGQEQDEVGRNFSAGEAFNGRLSQFNLWQNVLPEAEIVSLASYRCVQSAGNVIAWTDFEKLPSEEVKKEVSFCKGQSQQIYIDPPAYIFICLMVC